MIKRPTFLHYKSGTTAAISGKLNANLYEVIMTSLQGGGR